MTDDGPLGTAREEAPGEEAPHEEARPESDLNDLTDREKASYRVGFNHGAQAIIELIGSTLMESDDAIKSGEIFAGTGFE